MKEKREGNRAKATVKHNTAAIHGSGVNDDLEVQLEKAEAALRDLQDMKVRLEAEKKRIKQSAENEKEEAVLKQLQEENKKLRSEISSLKEIIGSLKDDLAATAELFHSSVTESLKKLEATHGLKTPDNDKPGKVVPETNISSAQPEPMLQPAANESVKETVPAADGTGDPKTETSISAPAEINPRPAAPKPPEQSQAEKPAEPIPNPAPEPAKPENCTVAINMEDELSEYEKIKKELEALEKDGTLLGNGNPVIEAAAETAAASTVSGAQASEPTPVTPIETGSVPSPSQALQPAPAPTESQPPPLPQETASAAPPSQPSAAFWDDKKQPAKPAGDKSKKKRQFIVMFKKSADNPKPAKTGGKDGAKPTAKGGKIFIKLAGFIMIIFAGVTAYQIANAENLRSVYTNQVISAITQTLATTGSPENAPEEFTKQPLEIRYKEAFANVPLESTTWQTYRDPDFGIKIDYPDNTSHKLRPAGSDNIWFLRRAGYLVKIDRFKTDQPLEEFWAEQKSDIKYRIEASSVKNVSAMHLIQDEYLPVRGNIYLIKVKGTIFRIWYKTYAAGEDPDDEQRVKRMIDSLEILQREENNSKD